MGGHACVTATLHATGFLWVTRAPQSAGIWGVPLAHWFACADCDSVDILARSRQRQAGALALSPRQHLKVLIAIPLAPRTLLTGIGDAHSGQKHPILPRLADPCFPALFGHGAVSHED